MARPRKEIDQKQFENLCGLQCTLVEICGWFDVTDKTLDSWCKRTYHASFSEVFKQKRGAGKISLRRSQWQLATKSASMAIWLGKQYLGQRDVVEQTIAVDTVKDDALSQSLRELADGLKSDD
jgi:hypothetical protein|nr:MAG TPA: putative terminase small subunit [Caudoviricetes sp.]